MTVRRQTFPGRLDQIEVICRVVDEGARDAGFDRSTSYACQLAVSEACENIVKHGYGVEGGGKIDVAIWSEPGELTIELRDSAPPFNPARRPDQQKWTEKDPPVGGLGLLIIHRVMDEIEYHRRGGENRLRMRKRQNPTIAEPEQTQR